MPKPGFRYRTRSLERFTGVVCYNTKVHANLGSLMRTCTVMGGVNFFATIGKDYNRPRADVCQSPKRIPTFHYDSWKEFYKYGRPRNCELVGIEQHKRSVPLEKFTWPDRCIIVLGAEDEGIPTEYLKQCRYKIELPSACGESLNLAVAGGICLYNRLVVD